MRKIPFLALGAIGLAEGVAALRRQDKRRCLYQEAKKRAQQVGRPLLVVGDPDAGAHTRIVRGYGCGDECLDLYGCPACSVQYQADITRFNPQFANNSRVVFVSCVLEYVSDLGQSWKEILRIAGSPDNVFLVAVQPWTLTSTLYPGAKRTVQWVKGRHCQGILGRPVDGASKVGSLLLVGGLFAWALWPEKKKKGA